MAPASIPVELRRLVREDAADRCGYCHTPEAYIGMPLEFDHLHPEALGGPTERENLWLACTRCNDFKGDRIVGADPETGETLRSSTPARNAGPGISPGQRAEPILRPHPTGRATVVTLRLNNEFIVVTRQFWVEAGWWPPAGER